MFALIVLIILAFNMLLATAIAFEAGGWITVWQLWQPFLWVIGGLIVLGYVIEGLSFVARKIRSIA